MQKENGVRERERQGEGEGEGKGEGEGGRPGTATGAGTEEAWARVENGLISGIGHGLNNRAAAIAALAQVLSMNHADDPLAQRLTVESELLEETIGLLRLLVRSREAPAEPVLLSEMLVDVQRVMRHHKVLRDRPFDQEIEDGVLPVYAEPSSLLHALCMLIGEAAAAADEAGIHVRCYGDERTSTVEITGDGDDAEGIADAEMLVARFGGVVTAADASGGQRRIRLEMPTLPEVRRRGGGGGDKVIR